VCVPGARGNHAPWGVGVCLGLGVGAGGGSNALWGWAVASGSGGVLGAVADRVARRGGRLGSLQEKSGMTALFLQRTRVVPLRGRAGHWRGPGRPSSSQLVA
jgi:hypothetical protein